MRFRKRTILVTLSASLGLGFAMLAAAVPAPIVCAVIGFSDMERLPDGALVQPKTSEVQRHELALLQIQAKTRIQSMFGTPRARPIVVFIQDTKAFWPFTLPTTGGAYFIGPRACLILGPNGQNVDVIAHELMHAELFERVGALRRLIEVPMWFDEGLGMQVDFRSRYNWEEQQSGNNTAFVRQFNSFRQFHQINETQRILNYAAAKVEVAQWLNVVGKQTLFEHFKLVSDGENFDAMLAK